MNKVALIGEYNPDSHSHQATLAAILHANNELGSKVEVTWISTANINASLFDEYAGIWAAPGIPYKNLEKALWAIKYARENNIPCLGTCGGFQHIIIEYARNCLGYHNAQHAEYDPSAANLFITPLMCSPFGKAMEIQFIADSNIAKIYENTKAIENYYCNFGINPTIAHLFKPNLLPKSRLNGPTQGPLHSVGFDAEGDIRVVEISTHPFFIGTLFVPQINSTMAKPHPLIIAFLKAVISKK